jgi:aspartyl-tRNA(Asn)/glutamyl-tRNA(Gln) amidotransferase subunit A
VEDVAAVNAALAGCPRADFAGGVGGLQISVLSGFFAADVAPEVAGAVDEATGVLAGLSAHLVPVALPGAEQAHEDCGQLIRSKALAMHQADLDARPELFERGTRDRLRLAGGLTGLDHAILVERMLAWQRVVRRAFASGRPAADAHGARRDARRRGRRDDHDDRRRLPFTFPLSLARVPALSVPCGFTADGMPIGLQLAAAWWDDDLLLRAGVAYERATDWHTYRPAARKAR